MSSFCACAPLRIRARRSAIGSVTVLMNYVVGSAAGFFTRSLNGIPSSLKSDLASSFVRAVVTMVTSNPRQRCLNQALEKIIHHLTAQRHFGPDDLVFAQLEIRDAFLGAGLGGALPGNQSQLSLRIFHGLLHVGLRAHGSVHHHL